MLRVMSPKYKLLILALCKEASIMCLLYCGAQLAVAFSHFHRLSRAFTVKSVSLDHCKP